MRYRYYVTHEQQRRDREEPVWRVPAHDLEQTILNQLQQFLTDDGAVHNAIGGQDAGEIESGLLRARAAADGLAVGIVENQRRVVEQLVERIDLYDDHVDTVLCLSDLTSGGGTQHRLSFPVERLRGGKAVKLVISGSETVTANCDDRLVALVAEAHAARKAVLEQTGSLLQIADQLGRCRGALADMVRISYLAPDIVTAILEGRQPASLKRKTLMATKLSLDWSEQRRQLGFA